MIDHWYSPNTGATNSSGWTGLPGGYRYSGGFGYVNGSVRLLVVCFRVRFLLLVSCSWTTATSVSTEDYNGRVLRLFCSLRPGLKINTPSAFQTLFPSHLRDQRGGMGVRKFEKAF